MDQDLHCLVLSAIPETVVKISETRYEHLTSPVILERVSVDDLERFLSALSEMAGFYCNKFLFCGQFFGSFGPVFTGNSWTNGSEILPGHFVDRTEILKPCIYFLRQIFQKNDV